MFKRRKRDNRPVGPELTPTTRIRVIKDDCDWWECARCGDCNKWRTNPQSCGGCGAAAGLAAI